VIGDEMGMDDVGELPFQAPAGLLRGLGLVKFASVVDLPWAGVADLADRDQVQGTVELPVTRAVQTSHVLVSQAAMLLRWPQARCSL
jgi:hypothetical protein